MPVAKFDIAETDAAIIIKIVVRAAGMMDIVDRLTLSMDLTACHANGCPLKLQELLEADRFNFMHDIAGIQRHMDRRTGELRDFFCPRFAA